MIGRTLSHFELTAKLGKGGMGEVYLAKDLKLGRQVALKLLPAEVADDPERLERLEREARVLAELDHPNIVPIFSLDEAEGVRFLIMAHIEGRTLAEIIRPRGLPLGRALELATQLAEALRAAHERGIIHRDLKPENVMVESDGRVRVLDFGLAKRGPAGLGALESQLPTEVATAEGVVMGTFPYMSPEQAQGKVVDSRSDIFSLGVILYEMATGKRPFRGDSALSVLSSIIKDTPPPVSQLRADLPRHLGRVIDHCLAKNPERRYQSVQDVRNELQALGKELEVERDLPASAARRPEPRGRRWILAVAVTGALVLAGIAFWERSRIKPTAAGAGATRIASVLALPSEVFGSTDEEYLTDAIPRSLSTHLAKLPSLETKAPPSRSEFERIEGDLDRLAGLYGVGAWVRSSITVEPERFVLNVQLVDVASRNLLWGDEFEGARGAYIDLVREAAEAVGGWLRPEQTLPKLVGAATSSDAELALRRGQFFSNRYNNSHHSEDFDSAVESFEELLLIQPDSAEAAAELGRLYIYRYEAGEEAALAEIARWGRRAVAADAKSSLGWSDLASAEANGGFEDLEGAIVFGLRAATLGPESGRVQNTLGLILDSGGLSTELGLEAYLEAAAIEPIYAYPYSNAAATISSLGRFEQALPLFDAALKIRPEDRWIHLQKWVLLSELGRAQEASAAWERLLEIEPDGGPATLVGELYEALASPEKAPEEAIARFRELLHSSVFTTWQVAGLAQSVFPVVAHLGASDLAFELIERSTVTGRAPPYDLLALSPLLDPIRQDPRFAAPLAAARARFEVLLRVLAEARPRGEVPPYLEASLADLLARLEAAGYLPAAA